MIKTNDMKIQLTNKIEIKIIIISKEAKEANHYAVQTGYRPWINAYDYSTTHCFNLGRLAIRINIIQ